MDFENICQQLCEQGHKITPVQKHIIKQRLMELLTDGTFTESQRRDWVRNREGFIHKYILEACREQTT